MPRTSTTIPARLSLDLYSLQGLSMNPNIDSFSFFPDPTSLYNMRVGELLKVRLGTHEAVSREGHEWGGRNGFLAKVLLEYDLIVAHETGCQ